MTDNLGTQMRAVNAVMDELGRIYRDPEGHLDSQKAVNALGTCAAMLFAGMPKDQRASEIEPWAAWVRETSMRKVKP